MKKEKIIGIILLIICTVIWGSAFSFQTMAKDEIGPFSLIAIRFIIAGVVLTPIVWIYVKAKKITINWKKTLFGGFLIGAFLAIASIVQQFGITQTSTGKAGFLTAMYIVFVPVISVLIFRKRLTLLQIIGIIATLVGVGLLSLDNDFSINIGDILCLIGSLFFAFQIIGVDKYSKTENGFVLAVVSFYSCGLLALIFSLFFEKVTITNIQNAIVPILFLGIGSSAIAYTLQFIGQQKISGVPASIIMSLEAVFSAIFAWILLQEVLSPKEIIGAILMMAGVIIVQVFDK